MQIAADKDPRSLRYQFAAARALQDAGMILESITYFERIIIVNAHYKYTSFWLGFAYQKTSQSQKAIDAYNSFLSSNTNHVQGHFNLAFELKNENDCKAAVVHFNKVLDLRPSYKEAHLHLSTCYKALGDEQQAAHHASIYKSKN